MEKTFTLDDFNKYFKKSNQQKNNVLKPSREVVNNILNFSKSYCVLKNKKGKSLGFNLN